MKKFPITLLNCATIDTSTLQGLASPEADLVEERAAQIFEQTFSEVGTTPAAVAVAFQASLGELPEQSGREDKVRDIAKAAALSTARSHGNIIDTGRTLLGNIDELCSALRLDVRRCKEQALLGLAEGACQIGPIVYGRFLDIACEYRDNADTWIAKNIRRPITFEPSQLPVIVPFESELTLKTQAICETPASSKPPLTDNEPEPPLPDNEPAAAASWSRPKEGGFFRRLSDVMGSFFGRK